MRKDYHKQLSLGLIKIGKSEQNDFIVDRSTETEYIDPSPGNIFNSDLERTSRYLSL